MSHTPEHSGGGGHLPAAAHGSCTGIAQLPHVRAVEAVRLIAGRQAHAWQRQRALRPSQLPISLCQQPPLTGGWHVQATLPGTEQLGRQHTGCFDQEWGDEPHMEARN